MGKGIHFHIHFNPGNKYHLLAAGYMETVKGKYKTAFIAAAIEAYRQLHPHGVDYRELEEIARESWESFQPGTPILENLERRKAARNAAQPVPPEKPAAREENTSAEVEEAISNALDYYSVL